MMTQKERFLALLHNEPVDGFVNQYGGRVSALAIIRCPWWRPRPGGQKSQSGWGFWYNWPANEPGAVALTDEEHLLIKDIEDWRKYVKAPDLSSKDSDWDDFPGPGPCGGQQREVPGGLHVPGHL